MDAPASSEIGANLQQIVRDLSEKPLLDREVRQVYFDNDLIRTMRIDDSGLANKEPDNALRTASPPLSLGLLASLARSQT